MQCGIVGLPNVGKSTLFNALTKTKSAIAANYPFCTIDPNEGVAEIYDEQLIILAKIANSEKIINSYIKFVDIAGLVKGASTGEGLGNQFLGNIRNTDAIVHVVRCFDDENITHVNGNVNPIYDIEIINTELILSDIETIKKKRANIEKKARIQKTPDLIDELNLLDECEELLNNGKCIREKYNEILHKNVKQLGLLTSKPIIYVANVTEEFINKGNDWSNQVKEIAIKENASFALISASTEETIANLEDETEKLEYMQMLDIKISGLSNVAGLCRNALNIKTFYTIGKKEARSWHFKNGMKAPETAGIIHTDFEKGFIRAEVIGYNDYIQYNGESGAKEAGKWRLEGKTYIVQDGDVMHFRFNV